ncbi:MAG: hypothetical protein ACHQRL_06715 [Gemmatimonadales bacterium]|jgi:hypothetical protein
MTSSMTFAQASALAVIAIAIVAIAIAAPIVGLSPGASWRAKAAVGLTMLEGVLVVVRRVLGL